MNSPSSALPPRAPGRVSVRSRAPGRASTALVGMLVALAASSAQASGFELNPPGGRSLGRAGTGGGGADDALGVFLNPATLLANQARFEAALSLQGNLSDTCMTRVEVNATIQADGQIDGAQTAGMRLPKVCDKGGMALIPELANTLRLGEHW